MKRHEREVVAGVKRYKFQALVTMHEGKDPALGPDPRRMVLRGRNDENHSSQFFNALVSCDDEGPFRAGHPQQLVTLRVAGDDVADFFTIGGHFALWLGDEVGQGVVTRRLFF